MSERVSIFEGKEPIIIIAPHCEDSNIEFIAEEMIKSLNCYGVLNRGWKNTYNFNYENERADCNNIFHIKNEVIINEFYNPIVKFQKRLRKKNDKIYLFVLRGIEFNVRKDINDQTLDIVLGYGAGKPPSYSFNLWEKDYFAHFLEKGGLSVYEAQARSKYAARNKKSLIQLFKMHSWSLSDSGTNAMEVSIMEDLRDERAIAEITGQFLADSVKSMLAQKKPWHRPYGHKPKLI